MSPADEVASKDIWLRKEDEIVGLHAIGYPEEHEFNLHHLDGSVERIKSDFVELEKWGNEYNQQFQMIGKGSFRVFDLTLEHAARAFEEDGWVRFERKLP